VKAHRDRRFVWLPWVVSAVAIALAATLWLRPVRTASSPPQTVRLAIPAPKGGSFFQFFETACLCRRTEPASRSQDATLLVRGAGSREVYVSPFPPTGETLTVSSGGGSAGRWSRDDRELFYPSSDNRLMSVPVQTSPSLHVGAPVPLFRIESKPLVVRLRRLVYGKVSLNGVGEALCRATSDRRVELDSATRPARSALAAQDRTDQRALSSRSNRGAKNVSKRRRSH
jgi:hypothetical protein